LSIKWVGAKTPPQRQKEYDRFDGAMATMATMAAGHDYKKNPVGADAPLQNLKLAVCSLYPEEWKRRKKKGETERPPGKIKRYNIWRWPKGHPKGGKFAKARP
jgi:hypothetical protein